MEKQLAKCETLLVKTETSNKLGTRMFKYEKASLFKAKQHNVATKIYDKSKINEQDCQFCDDCLNIIPSDPESSRLAIYFKEEDISHLGRGISLYFTYIRLVLMVFVIGLVASSIILMIYNWKVSEQVTPFCESGQDLSDSVSKLCKAYKQISENSKFYQFGTVGIMFLNELSKQLDVELPLLMNNMQIYFIFNILLIVLLIIIIYIVLDNTDEKLDMMNETLEDYSVLISNVPKSINPEIFKKMIVANNIRPIEFIPLPRLSRYNSYLVRLLELQKRIEYCNEKELTEYKTLCNKESIVEMNEEAESLITNLSVIETSLISTSAYDSDIFSGKVIAVFNTDEESKKFREFAETNFVTQIFKCLNSTQNTFNSFDYENAPEPCDILWENIEVKFSTQLFRKVSMIVLNSFMIIGATIILFYLTKLQKDLDPEEDSLQLFLSVLYTILTNFTNTLVCQLLLFGSVMEKHYTKSDFYLSVSYKLTIFSFFTTGIIPIALYIIQRDRNDVINASSSYYVFESNIITIFIVNSLYPLYWLVDPMFLFKLFKRRQAEKHFDELEIQKLQDRNTLAVEDHNTKSSNYTQEELNMLFENPSFDLYYKYSYLGKTILLTFMYAPILPLAAILSSAGLLILYFVERFKTSYVYMIPEKLSHNITFGYHFLLKLALLIYVAISCSADFVLLNNDNNVLDSKMIIYTVLQVLPAILLIFFPISSIKEKYMFFDTSYQGSSYYEKYFSYSSNYENINPITSVRGNERYLSKLIELKLVTNYEKQQFLKGELEGVSNLMDLYYFALGIKKNNVGFGFNQKFNQIKNIQSYYNQFQTNKECELQYQNAGWSS